jgi:diacylglycerol kinase (ATP)
MTQVAVVAHAGKSIDGGLDELRSTLAHQGVVEPLWFEVPKSRKAPERARQAVEEGADLIFVWGGDGMVQRCVDALADTGVAIAIIPAGTANLFATNIGIPRSLAQAVEIGLYGNRHTFDLGRINGERFAVMAGAGFDAKMIRDADGGLKDKAGRLAYVWTGARNLNTERVRMQVRVDGVDWFDGPASCLLLANIGTLSGGLTAFPDAQPDDGVLEVGVVTAKGPVQWSRVIARMAAGRLNGSKFTRQTTARKIDVRLARKLPYELDGGDRNATKRLKIRVEAAAITVCVPNGNVA